MTPEQINNWREVLRGMIGKLADQMTDEQIIIHRDVYQREIDKMTADIFKDKKAPKTDVE